MTLRVTLSIVPFGEEEKEEVIRTINISNLGKVPNDLGSEHPYRYGVQVDSYKTGEYDTFVSHCRSDGPEILTYLVIDTLLKEGKL